VPDHCGDGLTPLEHDCTSHASLRARPKPRRFVTHCITFLSTHIIEQAKSSRAKPDKTRSGDPRGYCICLCIPLYRAVMNLYKSTENKSFLWPVYVSTIRSTGDTLGRSSPIKRKRAEATRREGEGEGKGEMARRRTRSERIGDRDVSADQARRRVHP
jgi:hypothetical protein